MAKYMYIRVSSKDQNEARQLEDVEKLDIPQENVFIDKQSGKNFDRPEYLRMVKLLKEGDVVYFHSIDRMGRNYDQILIEWAYITKEIKADIVILDMPLLDTTMKNSDLTSKLIADIVLQLLSYVAEKERENIKRRQAEGIKIKREQDGYRQMKATDEEFFEVKRLVDEGKIAVSTACARLGLKSRKSWYNRLEIYKRDGKL